MSAATSARRTACALLAQQRRQSARARDLMRTSPALAALDDRDRAFAMRLVLGVVASSGALDALLETHLSQGKKLEPRVRDALRLAAFELCWLGTPSPVAVSQGVELVRRVAPRAAGLANAVLRQVARIDMPARKAALQRVRTGESFTIDDLASVSGYPAWLLREIADSRGVARAADTALASLEPAPVYAATNWALHDAYATARLLSDAQTHPQPTVLDDSFVLTAPAGLASSAVVWDTDVVIADLSAQLVAQVCAPLPGMRVLEVGQGRATKTLLLQSIALKQGGPLQLVGIDVEAFKTEIAARRVERAKLTDQVRCLTFDARCLAEDRALPSELSGNFDLVVVDAPCTGSGTLRRHPELPWRLEKDALSGVGSLPELQLALLCASASRVRPEGMLVYATCSLLKQENEQVIETFLASDAGRAFTPESVGPRLASLLEKQPFFGEPITSEGYLQTAVTCAGPDGHFCACLRRRHSL